MSSVALHVMQLMQRVTDLEATRVKMWCSRVAACWVGPGIGSSHEVLKPLSGKCSWVAAEWVSPASPSADLGL